MKTNILKSIHLKTKIYLNPFFLGDINKGINLNLQRYLLRWVPSLSGVLLGWHDLKIDSTETFTHDEINPTIEIPLSFKAIVFTPKEGQIMKGKLVYKGYDHIAVRVLSLWNVSIPKSRISDEIDWESLNEGTTVQFRIHKLHMKNNLLSIQGSLMGGGEIGIVSNDEEYKPKKKKAKM